jgi:hypothetical protein
MLTRALAASFLLVGFSHCKTTDAESDSRIAGTPSNQSSAVNRINIGLGSKDYLTKWKPDFATGLGGFAGVKYEFDAKDSTFRLNGQASPLKKMKLRGQTCKKAERKCLGVHTEEKVKFSGQDPVKADEFNLVSLWQDEGYISNKICFTLLNRLGVMNLKSNYAHLTVDALGSPHNAGIYLITEKPDEVLKKKKYDSPLVLRRGINDKAEVESTDDPALEATYHEMYAWAKAANSGRLSPEDFAARIAARLDLKSYFRWMAFNGLVRNQDFQDEVFFYIDPRQSTPENPVFAVFPWDFDDTFQGPQSGVLATLKRLTTREDSLDKAIAGNEILQAKFDEVAKEMMAEITDAMLTDVQETVAADIEPYLTKDIVGVSSKEDGKDVRHDRVYILGLLTERLSEISNSSKDLRQ